MLLESALADLSHLHDAPYGIKEYPASIPPDWDDIPGITKSRSTKSGELGRSARSGELGRTAKSGELGRHAPPGRSGELGRRSGDLGRKPAELGRRSGELGRRSGELGRRPAAAPPTLTKSVTAPASRFRDPAPPPPRPPPAATSVRTKSQHSRSHARFQPNLETQNETSEHSDEDLNVDSEEDRDEEQEQEQDQEEVKKDVIVQSKNYGQPRAQDSADKNQSESPGGYWSTGAALSPDRLHHKKSYRRQAPPPEQLPEDQDDSEEEDRYKEEKIELDLEVGVEILTARLNKSGELGANGLPSSRNSSSSKSTERTDSGTRRSGAVPFKWEQEPGVSKYKEEEPGFRTTVGGKTISLSGPLTPPPGAVAAAAAAARAAHERELAATAKDKSITDKMRSILTGKFSGQLTKPPLPPPVQQAAPPVTSRPVPKTKKVSFYETDVVVTFDNGDDHESSPVSILDRPESPTSPPYSPPHCPAPHGPAPLSPLKPPAAAAIVPARRPGTLGGIQLAQHLIQLTGMHTSEQEDHERGYNSSAEEQEESDQDTLWDAGEDLSEPSSWSSNNGSSRRVHPLPAPAPTGMTKSHSMVESAASRVRRTHTRARGDSWSAGTQTQDNNFEPADADLSDLEYESQRIKPGPAPVPPKRDLGKPPLARPSSWQVSGELGLHAPLRHMSGDLGLMRPPASRHVSGELGLTAPTPVGILKTGGSRHVSGELGILKHHHGGSRHVSGELGLAKPSSSSRPVSGELGRVQISTRPTTGSLPSSPDRDVYHTAPGSMRTSRRASGELSYPFTSAESSPAHSSYASNNLDRSAPTTGLDDPPESDHDYPSGQPASRIRNPFGSLKGEPMIKNGRIIYAGSTSFDDDDFSFEERADEVVHTVDESLYAISPIASAFVFPGSAGSTPSASPQVNLTGSMSQKNSGLLGGGDISGPQLSTGSTRNMSFGGGPRLVRSGTVTVASTRHSVSNSFDSFSREDGVGPNIMNGSTLLRRLSNVETEIDKPAKTAMNCAMACLPFRSLLGLKSSTPAVSRRNSRLSIASHRDPFEDRLKAT